MAERRSGFCIRLMVAWRSLVMLCWHGGDVLKSVQVSWPKAEVDSATCVEDFALLRHAQAALPTHFFGGTLYLCFFFFNLDFPIVTLLLLICCYVISRTIGELRPFETAFLNIRRIKNLKKNSPRYPPGLAFPRCWDYQPIRAGERSARLFVWGVT